MINDGMLEFYNVLGFIYGGFVVIFQNAPFDVHSLCEEINDVKKCLNSTSKTL